MAKFSGGSVGGYGAARPSAVTHEGGAGYGRSARQELFLLAVSEMAEDTYYESAEERRQRLSALVYRVLGEVGGWDWVCELVGWLRGQGMRSVSIMVAAEAVSYSRLPLAAHGRGTGMSARQLVASACARGDEPAEFLGYWLEFHGRKIPAPVKRGIADAAVRLYGERNALRYDGGSRSVRMADVIELTHPSPGSSSQSALFRHLIDARHGRAVSSPELPALAARVRLEGLSADERHAFMRSVSAGNGSASAEFELALAGQWEWAKSWLGAR